MTEIHVHVMECIDRAIFEGKLRELYVCTTTLGCKHQNVKWS